MTEEQKTNVMVAWEAFYDQIHEPCRVSIFLKNLYDVAITTAKTAKPDPLNMNPAHYEELAKSTISNLRDLLGETDPILTQSQMDAFISILMDITLKLFDPKHLGHIRESLLPVVTVLQNQLLIEQNNILLGRRGNSIVGISKGVRAEINSASKKNRK